KDQAAPAAKPEQIVQAEPQLQSPAAQLESGDTDATALRVRLLNVSEKDANALREEMALLGDVVHTERDADGESIWLKTTASVSDIEAVCCFIIDEKQLKISKESVPAQTSPASQVQQAAPAVEQNVAEPKPAAAPTPAKPAAEKPAASNGKPAAAAKDSSTIRVGVEKVDQIINLVGELVITQAMLVQMASTLDPVMHGRLLNGIEQLDRNA